jgi:hypothetical protein
VGGATLEGGTGLRGLTDRLAVLDGRLELSSPPGVGTRVEAHIPCMPGSLVAEASTPRPPAAELPEPFPGPPNGDPSPAAAPQPEAPR